MIKNIWSYWNDDENLPPSVKFAKHTWEKHNKNSEIHMISDNTLNQFIDISLLPKNYNNVPLIKKTDIIRLTLLEKYGGVWLDANIYLNKPLDIYWDENYDVGGFYADHFTTNINFPVLESWFISAPKNSELIKNWKDELYKGVDYSNNYTNPEKYIIDLEKEIDLQYIGKTDKITMEGKIYLMIHCSFLYVISKKSYNLKILPACGHNNPLNYLVKNNWNPTSAVLFLLKNTDNIPPDIIKLRGSERNIIDNNWDKLEEYSIMKKLIN